MDTTSCSKGRHGHGGRGRPLQQAQRPHCPRRTAGGACVYQGLLPLPVYCLKTRRNTKNKEGENLLTSASWSKRPKSSLRSLTSSCAVHCDARTVKPTMSAKTMLQGEEQTVYSMPRPQRTALRLEPECLRWRYGELFREIYLYFNSVNEKALISFSLVRLMLFS